jgi:RNA polymerase sigma-70 factor (ECF subfamily)
MGEPDQRSDADLVRRFRGGDREAFAALYRLHFPAVYRFALYMTNDPRIASEITQDVFVWLVHHPRHYDPCRGELAGFLCGVTRKMLYQRQRLERRWLPLDESVGSAPAFAAGVEREQQAAALRQAIAALPARYREAVVLCDLEGKTYEEAAAQLECALGTVRSRLHRARELLARKLQGRKEGIRCL